MTLVEKNFQLQKTLSEKEKTALSLDRLEKEQSVNEGQLAQGKQAILSLQNTVLTEEQKFKGISEKKSKEFEELERQALNVKEMKDKLKEQESLFQKNADDTRKISHAINLLEVKEQESRSREKRIQDELKGQIGAQEQFALKEEETKTSLGDLKTGDGSQPAGFEAAGSPFERKQKRVEEKRGCQRRAAKEAQSAPPETGRRRKFFLHKLMWS